MFAIEFLDGNLEQAVALIDAMSDTYTIVPKQLNKILQ